VPVHERIYQPSDYKKLVLENGQIDEIAILDRRYAVRKIYGLAGFVCQYTKKTIKICPRCGSTNIGIDSRGDANAWDFCKDCSYRSHAEPGSLEAELSAGDSPAV
jgi:hypothetical protein